MRTRRFGWVGGCATLVLAAAVGCGSALTDSTDETWTPPRTAWGEPDLQGVWQHQSTTPLQRPGNVQGREFLTDDEVADIQTRENEILSKGIEGADDVRPDVEESPFQSNEYNRFWVYSGRAKTVNRRTSLIVEPSDGRIPLTPAAVKKEQFHELWVSNFPPEEHYNNSWLDRDTGERCLTDGTIGQMWAGTGPNRFIQGPGYVAMLHEQFRDRRIIPTDGRPPSDVPTWLGNATGRWEENTLVVETTHFLDKTDQWWQDLWKAASDTLQLVERWTRVGPDEMDYQLTVTDPSKFTQPWSVELTLTNILTAEEPLIFFEYACAEGNYGIVNALSAPRNLEKEDPSLKSRRTDFEEWLARNPELPSWTDLQAPPRRRP